MRASLPQYTTHRPAVRGVLLDVFETLFSCARLNPVFTSYGIDPARVPLWLSLIFSSGISLTAAQDYRRFHDLAVSTLLAMEVGRIRRSDAQAVAAALQHLEPYPDVRPGLSMLREAGLRVFTLTLFDAAACEALFAEAGLSDLVDGFLSVDAVRRWKPAPEPYAYGAAQVGWPPAHVALISAHEWDVHGARRAGLQTGQILRFEAGPAPIFDRADASGIDLPSVVAKLLHSR